MAVRAITTLFRRSLVAAMPLFVNTTLNVMDGITYGPLLFPTWHPNFAQMAIPGVTMYLWSTIAAQLIFSLLSSFTGSGAVTACGIIENIPLFNAIALTINGRIGHDREALLATVLVAYSLSAVCASVLFFLLALFNVEGLISKFPRVLLYGSMGGIGLFLLATTGDIAAVATGGPRSGTVALAMCAIAVAAALAALYAEIRHRAAFVAPLGALTTCAAFYALAAAAMLARPALSLDALRSAGWLMSGPPTRPDPWQAFGHVILSRVDFEALLAATPMILGTAIFSTLHVPINVPSFARLTRQKFSMHSELLCHSASNLATAAIGMMPSYFVYTNSLLFLRAGATGRLSGVLLSGTTALALFWGLSIVPLIPTVVVLFLITYLALLLIWEAAICSRPLCDRTEYAILTMTALTMQAAGFLPGLILGATALGASLLIRFRWSKSRCAAEDERSVLLREDGRGATDGGQDTTEGDYATARTRFVSLRGFTYFANALDSLKSAVPRATATTAAPSLAGALIVDLSGLSYCDVNGREAIMDFMLAESAGGAAIICIGPDGPLCGLLGGLLSSPSAKLHIVAEPIPPARWLSHYVQRSISARQSSTLVDGQAPGALLGEAWPSSGAACEAACGGPPSR